MTKLKLRKIRYRTAKFFGWKKDRWARLGGINGKKRSYGHYAGMSDCRTRAELRDGDARLDAVEQERMIWPR
jgi:hypothetical protein